LSVDDSQRYGYLKPRTAEGAHAAVVQEIAREKAASLGRAGRRLEAALAALACGPESSSEQIDREDLLEEAGEALFFLVVQREACGLRDMTELVRELRITREVQLRMRPRRERPR
jgi:hypothetical protein